MAIISFEIIENVIELILKALNINTPYGKLDVLFAVAANVIMFRNKMFQTLAICIKIAFKLLPLFLVYYLTEEFYATEVRYYPITAGGGIMGGIIAFGLACIIAFIVYRITHPNLSDLEDREDER